MLRARSRRPTSEERSEYPTTLAVPLEVEIPFEGGGFVSVRSPVAAEIATEKID